MESLNERVRAVRRRFFAMRNGVVADRLRHAGSAYRIIFGLNLPQIADIAADYAPDAELGRFFWENSSARCSRLIAPMLLSPTDVDEAEALVMLTEARDAETIDTLCHKLLKHEPYALELVEQLRHSEESFHRYAALRLAATILPEEDERLMEIVRTEAARRDPLTLPAAAMLMPW